MTSISILVRVRLRVALWSMELYPAIIQFIFYFFIYIRMILPLFCDPIRSNVSDFVVLTCFEQVLSSKQLRYDQNMYSALYTL